MKSHFTDPYLLNPPHKITVDLIGMGGTGSQMITGLARMNAALLKLNHPGLHLRCWDHDIVSEANKGRQLFSEADLGINKAVVLVTRINRYFGFDWEARPEAWSSNQMSNIIISCVDSAIARLMIEMKLPRKEKKRSPTERPYYWLDLGNLRFTGQVVLGTILPIAQPRQSKVKTKSALPNVVKKFPYLRKLKEERQGPSCSLAEALLNQDLFINSTLAQFGCNLIWKLVREGKIRYHGCYVNLETFNVNPIKIA